MNNRFRIEPFLFFLLILVVFVPINLLQTTMIVNNKTQSLPLPEDRRGIEFPAVRQQLDRIEMSFTDLCDRWNLDASGSRALVSTALSNTDTGLLEIVKAEKNLSIFLGGETVFDRISSELFRDSCSLQMTIQGSKLSILGTEVFEVVQLAYVPRFSLLVVDESMLQSGNFTATLTTEIYGTQLTLLAALVRIVCFLFLLLLIKQFISLKPSKKVADA